jgi:hypothetical protein
MSQYIHDHIAEKNFNAIKFYDHKVGRLAIILRDGCRCIYCNGLCAPYALSLEHLSPRSKGGARNHPTNLVVACRSCNSARGNRPMGEFIDARGLDIFRIVADIRERTSRNPYAFLVQALCIIRPKRARAMGWL